MKVPPIYGLGAVRVPKLRKMGKAGNFIKPLKNDTVSFTSDAKYIKKYATLPDEIKKVLNPRDAVDMFREIEWLEKGMIEANEIGKGVGSKVYKNPWLQDYYLLILKDPELKDTITIFSGEKLGDAIWHDDKDYNVQFLKRNN